MSSGYHIGQFIPILRFAFAAAVYPRIDINTCGHRQPNLSFAVHILLIFFHHTENLKAGIRNYDNGFEVNYIKFVKCSSLTMANMCCRQEAQNTQQCSWFGKSVSQTVWYVISENVGIRATDDSSRYPSQRFTIELYLFVFDVLQGHVRTLTRQRQDAPLCGF